MAAISSRTELETVAVRFAGDLGDGMHLAGDQMTRTSAVAGNAVFTWPDYPAEIRAPAGTMAGITGFQLQFGASAPTAGDQVQLLVAMNPVALRANLPDVEPGGIIVINTDLFVPSEWVKAGYDRDPLADGTLAGFRVIRCPAIMLNREAVAGLKLAPREADRSRTFFVLGLVFWIYDRSMEPTLHWMKDRFAADVLKANKRSLKAGWKFGESLAERLPGYTVSAMTYGPGSYRQLSGAAALALGLATAANVTGREVVCAGVPVPTASELLHHLMERTTPGVSTLQAEDDAAAAGIALGASYGGAIGAVVSTGVGLSSVSEIVGLGVITELPMLILHSQQVGPAVGLPGRTEQSDLFQALFGRNGECPVPVLAVRSPADGFDVILEAVRLAIRYMTPVIVLTDAYLMQASEPWRVPHVDSLPKLALLSPRASTLDPAKPFLPYSRDVHLARPWAIPGTVGAEHRIGGLEKEDGTGIVSYEPADHEHMVHVRAQKIAQIAGDMPRMVVDGASDGDVLLLGWGSTFGAIRAAIAELRKTGLNASHAHLRTLNPLPDNTAEVLRRFRRVIVAELNTGQLRMWIRSQLGVSVEAMTKVQGKPFTSAEIEERVRQPNRPRLHPEPVDL